MKKRWKRSQNATMIFWRKRERDEKRAKEKKFAVKGEKLERGMSISQHWVVRTSTGIAILFKVHSRSLPDQLFLYIFHQVVMMLFQAVTIIFSLMAITLVVLLSTLGKCQQQTQFNTGTNRCYCDAFAFTSGGSFCSHVSALRLIAHNLAQSVVQSNSGLVALKAVSPLQFSTHMARQCLETSTVQYIWLVDSVTV